MSTELGAAFVDVSSLEGLKVDREGPWTVYVRATWGTDKPMPELGAPDWWKANTAAAADW
jgi:hypothetical protein